MAATHDPGATMLQENPDAALRVFQGGAISIDGIAGISLSGELAGLLSGETVNSIYDISDDDFDKIFRAIRGNLEADREFTEWRARSGVKHTIDSYVDRQSTSGTSPVPSHVPHGTSPVPSHVPPGTHLEPHLESSSGSHRGPLISYTSSNLHNHNSDIATELPSYDNTPLDNTPIQFNENRRIGIDSPIGNSCFIDTTLQLLADSPEFVKLLNTFNIPENIDNLTAEEQRTITRIYYLKAIIRELHRVDDNVQYDVAEYCENKYIPILPEIYHYIIPEIVTNASGTGVEQIDISEIFKILLDNISDYIRRKNLDITFPFLIYKNSDSIDNTEASPNFLTIYSGYVSDATRSISIQTLIDDRFDDDSERSLSQNWKTAISANIGTMNELLIYISRASSYHNIRITNVTDISNVNILNKRFKLRGITVYTTPELTARENPDGSRRAPGSCGHYRYVKYNINGEHVVFNGQYVCDNAHSDPDRFTDMYNRAITNIEGSGIMYLYERVIPPNEEENNGGIHIGGDTTHKSPQKPQRRTLKNRRQPPKKARRTLGHASRVSKKL